MSVTSLGGTSEFCTALKKDGSKCTYRSKNNNLCGVHKNYILPKVKKDINVSHSQLPSPLQSPLESVYTTYIPATDQSMFITDSDGLKSTLEKYGVAIILNVINDEEIESMKKGIWNYFEHITQKFEKPIRREEKESWKSFYQLYPKHGMLIQNWEIGHSQFLWDLRQNPKIVNIFAKLWDVNPEDLLVSFDGASFSLPHEVTNRGYYRGKDWLHLDQRLSNPDFECVQSWVTGWDVNPGDATLTVLEGSNTHFEHFSKVFKKKTQTTDWYILKPDEIDWFIHQGCVQRDITCPAGSMVFWDSRSVHSGKEPLKNRLKPNFRGVGYLSYTPRSMATKASLKKKIEAFNNKRTTSHWPHRIKLFPIKPRTYGNELPPITSIENPNITKLGLRLIGSE